MDFELRKKGGEVVQCDSCEFPAATAGFDWGPFHAQSDKPQRLLCEFCCTTMAGRYTEYPAYSDHERMRAEVWKAAAGVFHMLARSKPLYNSASAGTTSGSTLP